MRPAVEIHLADPSRLKNADEPTPAGDVYTSYSADRVGQNRHIRRPFTFRGGQWVCMALYGGGEDVRAVAYRITRPPLPDTPAVSFEQRCHDADHFREHPRGFYHGVSVRLAGGPWVLSGPPAVFIAGERHQPGLFDVPAASVKSNRQR